MAVRKVRRRRRRAYKNVPITREEWDNGHRVKGLPWWKRLRLWFRRGQQTIFHKNVRFSAELRLKHYKADGTVEDYGVVSKRLVTQAFVKRLSAQMAANFGAGDNWKYHDAGEDGAAEDNSHTGLLDPWGGARAVGSQTTADTATQGVYVTVGLITFTGSFTIEEHGLFNAAAAGILLDRSVHIPVIVNASDQIQYTYSLTIHPE